MDTHTTAVTVSAITLFITVKSFLLPLLCWFCFSLSVVRALNPRSILLASFLKVCSTILLIIVLCFIDLQNLFLTAQAFVISTRIQNNFLKEWWLSLPKYIKRHKFTDSRHIENSRQDKLKKTTPRYIRIKLLKIKDKEKYWKQPEKNYSLLEGEQWLKIFHQKQWWSKGRETKQHLQKYAMKCQLRILNTATIFFKNEGKIKTYSEEKN